MDDKERRHRAASMLEHMAALLRRGYGISHTRQEENDVTIYATKDISVPPITVHDAELAYPMTRFNQAKKIFFEDCVFANEFYLGLAEFVLDDYCNADGFPLVVTPELLAGFANVLYQDSFMDDEVTRMAREDLSLFLEETRIPFEYEDDEVD